MTAGTSAPTVVAACSAELFAEFFSPDDAARLEAVAALDDPSVTPDALTAVAFIDRQRSQSNPLQLFAFDGDRAKGHVAYDLTFVIRRHHAQRDQAIFTKTVHQLRFRVAAEGTTQ